LVKTKTLGTTAEIAFQHDTDIPWATAVFHSAQGGEQLMGKEDRSKTGVLATYA